MGIFDFDRRVVHQDADGECEAAEGHDVDRLAKRGQDGERGGNGERNRGADDEGRAPGTEEQQDHEAGERGRDGGFAGTTSD